VKCSWEHADLPRVFMQKLGTKQRIMGNWKIQTSCWQTPNMLYNHSQHFFTTSNITIVPSYLWLKILIKFHTSTTLYANKNNNQCSFSYLTIYSIQCWLSQINRIMGLMLCLIYTYTVEINSRKRYTSYPLLDTTQV